MTNLLTIAEAAPRVRKTEAGMRWWLRQTECPIVTVKIGGRRFVREGDIEAYIERQVKAASA